jgi:hypothetical protein
MIVRFSYGWQPFLDIRSFDQAILNTVADSVRYSGMYKGELEWSVQLLLEHLLLYFADKITVKLPRSRSPIVLVIIIRRKLTNES